MRIKSGEEVLHDAPKMFVGVIILMIVANVIAGLFGWSLPFPGK